MTKTLIKFSLLVAGNTSLLLNVAFAQFNPSTSTIPTMNTTFDKCGTTTAFERMAHDNPRMYQLQNEADQMFLDFINGSGKTDETSGQQQGENDIYTIPVVVHIIHMEGHPYGMGQNISDERVYEQMQILNDDFRRLNSDASNTLPQFAGVAADVEIEFCLAQRTENGDTTSGIMRYPTGAPAFPPYEYDEYIKTELAPQWDPYHYLNIWVIQWIQGSPIGYAYFPWSADGEWWDGIMIDVDWFGVNPPSYGRTLTHEAGHYLGLYHTWGPQNANACNYDDYVDDTPNCGAPHYGCSTSNATCGSQDMVQNYMDYSEDACQNLYTLGQKERIWFFTELIRNDLVTANFACSPPPPGPPIADFFIEDPDASNCPDATFYITSNAQNADEQHYVYPGGAWEPMTEEAGETNGFLSYSQPGDYELKQIVSNVFGVDSMSKTITIYEFEDCPNPDFTSDITTVCQYQTVQYTNTSSTNDPEYYWDFDGTTYYYYGDVVNVMYPYEGIWNSELLAINDFGYTIETKEDYVTVLPSTDLQCTASSKNPSGYNVQVNQNHSRSTLDLIVQTPTFSHVHVMMYSIDGKIIRTLLNEQLIPGINERIMDTGYFSTGIYLVEVITEGTNPVRQIVFVN